MFLARLESVHKLVEPVRATVALTTVPAIAAMAPGAATGNLRLPLTGSDVSAPRER